MLEDVNEWVASDDCTRFEMPEQTQTKCQQYNAGLRKGLHSDANTHNAVDDGFVFCARLSFHDIGVTLFHRQGQGRCSIGYQIQPQQLDGCQRSRKACQRRQEDDHDLSHIGRKQEEDEFTDITVDDATLLDGRDDAGVVVISQYHVGGLFSNIRAGDAHRHTNIGTFDGRGIVDAVTGHGDYFVMGLQRVHNAHLVLRGDTRKYIDGFDLLPERLICHLIKFCTGDDFLLRFHQTNRFGNRAGRLGVIASDHNGADTSLASHSQGFTDFGARRVDHADQPGKDQVVFNVLWSQFFGDFFDNFVSHSDHTQGFASHLVVGNTDALAHTIRHLGLLIIVGLVLRAEFEHHIRCAFDSHYVPVFDQIICLEGGEIFRLRIEHFMDGSHTFAHRIKRDFLYAWIIFAQFLVLFVCLRSSNYD